MADFDAIIIGAGAGGGVVASVLAARGWRVALIEKGRNPFPALSEPILRGSLFGNDEIKRLRGYASHDPRIEPRVFQGGNDAVPSVGSLQPLGVGVGGGTLFYDGDSPRVQRTDLTMRSTFGDVDGAAMVDWPIDYDELAPFYDAAEAAVGVQGDAASDPFAEARSPYPMPPGYPAKSGLILSEGARSLGYHPHPMPMAINSLGYRGRPACVNCGYCSAGCPVNAKGSSAVTVVRDALLTGRCTLLSESCVTRIEAAGRRAAGVALIGPDGAERTVTADQIIVAANAIETPRLLLASAGGDHPGGLGNSSGLVGRHLMFHLVFSAVGVFDEDIRPYRGRVITHALGDFTAWGDAQTPRGGYVELGGSIHPVEFASQLPWVLAPTVLADGSWFRRIASVTMMGEDVPVASNRVELDPTVRDVYGRPVARVVYARHPRDQAVVDTYLPLLAQIARASGAVSVMNRDFAVADGKPDTKHLLGTTRMGDDPADSVTDRWGRLHDLDNVWIADGGVFPTSTGFNPTLTQQALAWRTAAYLDDPTDVRP